MNTTIDEAGRLVVPKEIRRQAGLTPRMLLEVRCRDGRVEIEPAPLPVNLQRRGRMLVAVPRSRVEPLTSAEVRRARDEIMDDRTRRRR
jgi:AbrB family looped-hinge helix DNA binding protein